MASTNVASDMEGIELAGGTFTCANNIVSIGTGISGGYVMNGIWDESGTSSAIPHEKTTEDNPLQMIQIKFVAINIFRTNFGNGWQQIGC
jgi:hypothetical protein